MFGKFTVHIPLQRGIASQRSCLEKLEVLSFLALCRDPMGLDVDLTLQVSLPPFKTYNAKELHHYCLSLMVPLKMMAACPLSDRADMLLAQRRRVRCMLVSFATRYTPGFLFQYEYGRSQVFPRAQKERLRQLTM